MIMPVNAPTTISPGPSPTRAPRTLSRLVNPVILLFAGTRLFPFYGVIQHRGRRSGLRYRTPVVVGATHDALVVPMPWGEHTDWYRNVRGAGECVIRWKGRDYRVGPPEVIDADQATAAFGAAARAMMRRMGITRCVRLPHHGEPAHGSARERDGAASPVGADGVALRGAASGPVTSQHEENHARLV
jgi:deazaflavin-dependent oxidoreductase (nitroreductase family)